MVIVKDNVLQMFKHYLWEKHNNIPTLLPNAQNEHKFETYVQLCSTVILCL